MDPIDTPTMTVDRMLSNVTGRPDHDWKTMMTRKATAPTITAVRCLLTFTWVSTKQPLSFLPPTSVGPSIPSPPTSALKSWTFAASSRNRARVRPLLPCAFTTLLTTSRKNRPAAHDWAPKPSALDRPPTFFRNALMDLFCYASSNGTKNSDEY